MIWTNWAGNQVCLIQHLYTPATRQEIAKILDTQKRVRVTGSGHSWGPLFCDPYDMTTFVSTYHLTGMKMESYHLVTCESGVTLGQLGSFLEQQGYSLPNYPSPWEITIGGCISTATHGSGSSGTISSFVTQLELYSKDKKWILPSDHDLFLTSNVGLGLTGFLYSITLRIVPIRLLDEVECRCSSAYLFDHLDQWIAHYPLEYFSLWWNWKANQFSFHAYVKSTGYPDSKRGTQAEIDPSFYRSDFKKGTQADLSPPFYRSDFKKRSQVDLPPGFHRPLDKRRKSLFQQVMGSGGGKRIEAEYVIPIFVSRGKTLEKVCMLLQPLLYKLNYQSEIFIRFVNQDQNSFLSPTSRFLNTAKSFLFLIIQTQNQESIFKIVQDFLCIESGLHATFHWGKMWSLTTQSFEKIFGHKKQNFQQWLRNRDLLDPTDQFWNPRFNFLRSNR